MSMIPVEGRKGLYRDSSTNAIINTNSNDIIEYNRLKKQAKAKENEMIEIKNDINEIKAILTKILEK
jgi:hypothetical protein